MEMYRKFRGADPDKKPMLRARGLLKEEPVVEEVAEDVLEGELANPEFRTQPGATPKVAPRKPINATIKK
jgi:hypothetical protein